MQQCFQADGTPGPAAQQTTVVDQGQVFDAGQNTFLLVLRVWLPARYPQPASERYFAQSNQVKQRACKWVETSAVLSFIADGETILLPGAVEQGDQPVVKQVEPVAQRVFFEAFDFLVQRQQQLRIVPRQSAAGAG